MDWLYSEESRKQKAESRRQKAENRKMLDPFRKMTRVCLLPTAYCLLPTAYCLLPTAYCLLLTVPDFFLRAFLTSFSSRTTRQFFRIAGRGLRDYPAFVFGDFRERTFRQN